MNRNKTISHNKNSGNSNTIPSKTNNEEKNICLITLTPEEMNTVIAIIKRWFLEYIQRFP